MNTSRVLTYGTSGQLKLTNKKRLECMNECIKDPNCLSVLTAQSNLYNENSCLLQTGVSILVYYILGKKNNVNFISF
jgi:hypothetical protein